MNPKCVLLYLTPSCIYKTVYSLDFSGENIVKFDIANLVELRFFVEHNKEFSKREQCEIIDITKEWFNEFLSKNELSSVTTKESCNCQILLSSDFLRTTGSKSILETMENYLKVKSEKFSIEEETRQAFLGVKQYALNLSGANYGIGVLNIKQFETCVLSGDANNTRELICENFGIQNVCDFVSSTVKAKEKLTEEILIYLDSNLKYLTDNILLSGNIKILALDEDSSRLLIHVLNKKILTQKIPSAEIIEIADNLINQGSNFLKSIECINSENIVYATSYLLLISRLVKNLQADICVISPDDRFKGFIIHKGLESGRLKNSLPGHFAEWKNKAKKLLLNSCPEKVINSMQCANICTQLVNSSEGLLHMWNEKEKKFLWLSSFFFSFLKGKPKYLAIDFLSKVYCLSLEDCEFIFVIINFASTSQLSEQSEIIELIPVEKRALVKRLACFVQMASSLDITARGCIERVEIKASSEVLSGIKICLKSNSADLSPEIVQLGSCKKNFEKNFEQTMQVELINS